MKMNLIRLIDGLKKGNPKAINKLLTDAFGYKVRGNSHLHAVRVTNSRYNERELEDIVLFKGLFPPFRMAYPVGHFIKKDGSVLEVWWREYVGGLKKYAQLYERLTRKKVVINKKFQD